MGRALLLLGALAAAAWALAFVARGDAALVGEVGRGLATRRAAFVVHAVGGAVALLVLPWLLRDGLRARRPAVHRALGRVYGVALLASAAAGLRLALAAWGGPGARLGFASLAVGTLATTVLAVRAARRGRVVQHRRWALRSAALCCAAVTLRIELPLLMIATAGDFARVYPIVAWLCWVPNALVVEWWLRRAPRAAREHHATPAAHTARAAGVAPAGSTARALGAMMGRRPARRLRPLLPP